MVVTTQLGGTTTKMTEQKPIQQKTTESGLVWLTVDTVLFDSARVQLKHFDELQRDHPNEAERILYWETAYAGAAILLVCSAMEAHANYLCGHAARQALPNLSGLSEFLWSILERQLRPREKWELACNVVLGRPILDAGNYPFQKYLEGVEIRNQYIAHPKLTPQEVTLKEGKIDPSDFAELKKITAKNAKDIIEAARKTVQLFYGTLGTPPPKWAVD